MPWSSLLICKLDIPSSTFELPNIDYTKFSLKILWFINDLSIHSQHLALCPLAWYPVCFATAQTTSCGFYTVQASICPKERQVTLAI
jgi:hypothetical protein